LSYASHRGELRMNKPAHLLRYLRELAQAVAVVALAL
jgi:hypothetical protein